MTIQKRQWIWLAVTLFIYILALFLVRTFVHYTWRPETWISAIVGGVIVFYTYWTWRMAKVAAADLEMRTRPVVTFHLQGIKLESIDPATEIRDPHKLCMCTRIKNHSPTHGYAKLLIKFHHSEDLNSPQLIKSVESGSYSGKEVWAIPALAKTRGHTSVESAELMAVVKRCFEQQHSDKFYVALHVDVSASPDMGLSVPSPVVVYELKWPENAGIMGADIVAVPAGELSKPVP